MTLDITTYSSADVEASAGPAVPTAREIQALAVIGLDIGPTNRVVLMNRIAAVLGMPPGGWLGQARLFDGDDVRIRWLLGRLARPQQARVVAENVARAGRYVHGNLILAMVSAAREYDGSLTARGTALINTYHRGGLDFLEKQKAQLGLPRSVTRHWTPANPILNDETMNEVYPERIPAQDQLLAYAAQIASSYVHAFRHSLQLEVGEPAEAVLAAASRASLLVWQAYSFLAPGGTPYDPGKPLGHQLGQHFGSRSAIGYYGHLAKTEGRRVSLDDVLTNRGLDRLEWLRSAKTRAAETLFVERLLTSARDLLPN